MANIASKHDTDQMPTFSGTFSCSVAPEGSAWIWWTQIFPLETGMVIDYSLTSEQGTLWGQ